MMVGERERRFLFPSAGLPVGTVGNSKANEGDVPRVER